MAAELAHALRDGVVWVKAPQGDDVRTHDALQAQIADALAFHPPLPDPLVVGREAVRHAFQSQHFGRQRLLVLDDVTSPATVRRLVGREGPARVLVTTRHERVATAPLGWSIGEGAGISLGPFGPDESAAFLSATRVPGAQHEAIHKMTAGHPLALALVSEVVSHGERQPGTLPAEEVGAYPVVVEELLSRLIRRLPTAVHLEALRVLAVARVTSEALLGHVLGAQRVNRLFAWLRRLSFVESTAEGLIPHDLIREVILADLKRRDTDSYIALSVQVIDHLGNLVESGEPADAMSTCRGIGFVLGHGQARRVKAFESKGFFLGDASSATERDWPEIEAILREHEGAQSVALLRHWRERGAETFAFHEARGVSGFTQALRVDRASARAAATDPGVAAVLTGLRGLGVGPEEPVLLFRFWMGRDTYHQVSPTQTQIWMFFVAKMLMTPGVSLVGSVQEAHERWQPMLDISPLKHLSCADFELAGRRYVFLYHDLRGMTRREWVLGHIPQVFGVSDPPGG